LNAPDYRLWWPSRAVDTRGHNQGNTMNRTSLLVSGAICWTVAAAYAGIHVLNGDAVVPAAMAVVLAVWVGVRRTQLSAAIGREPQAVTAEA
jgi:hypothetical protein